MRKLFPVESPHPGEHVKFVPGISLLELICDSCDENIHKGDEICCFSSWADYGGIPYNAWEHEFIKITVST